MQTPTQRAKKVVVALNASSDGTEVVARTGRKNDAGYNKRGTMVARFAKDSMRKAVWMTEGMVDEG